MVKAIFISGLFGVIALNSFAQKEFKTDFAQKWQAKIGVSTYRTMMAFHDGKIFIGSNGLNRNFKNDSLDGVFEIDAKTGKILHHYAPPFAGDNDVNGVAIADGKLFFGTDNYYFFCFDLKTKEELWKYHLPYDVESTPIASDLNGDKKADIAFNVEGFYFYALNGVTGEILWGNKQITAHSGNSAPLKYDVNKDGIMDFITSGRGNAESDEIDGFKMAHYGDYNLAIDGKTGKTIWAVATGAGVHASPFINWNKKTPEFLFLDSYGQLSVISPNGKLLKTVNFGYDNFSSPSVTKDEHLVIGRGSMDYSDKAFEYNKEDSVFYVKNDAEYKSVEAGGRLSATTMIADILAKGTDQLIGITEDGILFISTTKGELIASYTLPAGAEASLFIEDIDGDKFLEILIADLAGNLTCYKTKSKAKATYGKFR